MKLKKTWICLIGILCISSCTHSSPFPKVTDISETVTREIQTLSFSIENVNINEIGIQDFSIYHDSLLIVLKSGKEPTDLFELWDIRSKQMVSSCIKKGNGPEEILGCNRIQVTDNGIFVFDYVKQQYGKIEINEQTRLMTPTPFTRISSPSSLSYVTEYNNDKLLVLNPLCFENKAIKIDNNQPRALIVSKNSNCEIVVKESVYETGNVSQGYLVSNITKNRIFFFSDSEDIVEIYDNNLNPLKKITGPVHLDTSYYVKDGNRVVFHKRIPYTYMGVTYNDDYVIASFIGDWYNDNLDCLNSKIILFDWDGNVVSCYDCGRYITSISLSNESGYIYATSIENGDKVLVKAALP